MGRAESNAQQWSNNIEVSIGNNSDHTKNPLCGNYTIESSGAYPCNLIGNYITFQKRNTDYLEICEIQLYSEKNIAIGKEALGTA